jgi:hypothetical protein
MTLSSLHKITFPRFFFLYLTNTTKLILQIRHRNLIQNLNLLNFRPSYYRSCWLLWTTTVGETSELRSNMRSLRLDLVLDRRSALTSVERSYINKCIRTTTVQRWKVDTRVQLRRADEDRRSSSSVTHTSVDRRAISVNAAI